MLMLKKAGTVTEDAETGELTSIVLASTIKGYEYQVAKGSNIIATSPLVQVDDV